MEKQESISRGENVKQRFGSVGLSDVFGNWKQVQVTLMMGTRGQGQSLEGVRWRQWLQAQGFAFQVRLS